mgnify:FL=1
MELTAKDKSILAIITAAGTIGPTDIGMELGKSYNSASSFCTPSLKRLMNAGFIVRIKTDKVRYKIKQPQK